MGLLLPQGRRAQPIMLERESEEEPMGTGVSPPPSGHSSWVWGLPQRGRLCCHQLNPFTAER